jgi:hypothetical protein
MSEKKKKRDELEKLEGEPLPDRIAMSLIDVGGTVIGYPGPNPPVELPEPAQEHAPLMHTMDEEAEPES